MQDRRLEGRHMNSVASISRASVSQNRRGRFQLDLFGRSWVKLWTTRTLTDPKIRRCNGSQRSMFFTCMMLAGESDADGALITGTVPITDDEILAMSGDPKPTARKALEHIIALGLIERRESVLTIPNFARAQESPAAARTRKWRGHKERHGDAQGDIDGDGHRDGQKTEDRRQKKNDVVVKSPDSELEGRMRQARLTGRQITNALTRGVEFAEGCLAYLESPPDGVNPLAIIGACIRDGRPAPAPNPRPPAPISVEERAKYGATAHERVLAKHPNLRGAGLSVSLAPAIDREIRALIALNAQSGAA